MAVFELYNADGSLQFNMSNRLGRVIGSVSVSGTGFFPIPLSNANCRPWAWASLAVAAAGSGAQLRFTATGVNYSVFSADGSPVLLVYGEY